MKLDLKYHKKNCLKSDNLGIINCWGFKNEYLFLNYEKGIVENILDIDDIKILNDTEYDKLYKERDLHIGNERERMYGIINERVLEIINTGKNTTHLTGKWSYNFCRELASMKANIELQKELRTVGIYKREDANKDMTIFYRHHLGDNCTYSRYCDKMFKEELSEYEILEIITEYHQQPDTWKNLKEDDGFGMTSLEMRMYLNFPITPPIIVNDNKEVLEWLKTREYYISNLNIKDSIKSIETTNRNDIKRISLIEQIISLYKSKKTLTTLDNEAIAENESELQQCKLHVQYRNILINILGSIEDKSILIQTHFKDQIIN